MPRVVLAFQLMLLLLISRATAQDIVRTETTVVLVPTLVKDTKGQTLLGLTSEDFLIEDDNIRQEVKLDDTPIAEPISLVVAVQRGRSAAKELGRMEGLGEMLDPLIRPTTQIAVVEFDSHVQMVRDFTADDNTVRRELKQIKPGDSGAAILDAVDYSLRMLAEAPNDALHVLLLVSETRDHGSGAKINDLITLAASNKNTVVYTLAFSPATSEVLDPFRGGSVNSRNTADLLAPLIMAGEAMRSNIPKAIAEMTGGEYSVFRSQASFDSRMTDFDNHLHDRYLLSFQPKEPHPGLHQIRVRLRQPKGATVLARSNYWMAQK